MNPVSACCSSCAEENEDNFFPMGNYVSPTPGYEQTYSMPTFKPMGEAGPLMASNMARPYSGAPGPLFPVPNFLPDNAELSQFINLPAVSRMGISPMGENMPAQIGRPTRMGQGIGGQVQSLGFFV